MSRVKPKNCYGRVPIGTLPERRRPLIVQGLFASLVGTAIGLAAMWVICEVLG